MNTFSLPDSDKNEEINLAYTLLQSSMESLKDVLIFSIDKDYRYLTFNSAFKNATEYVYGSKVANGISMLDTIADDTERLKAKQNCDRALQGESHSTIEVYGTLNPSYFETHYNPIRNKNGEIIGVTVLSTNVTERKMAEEQILALNRNLEAFSYSVAHDLRTPLRIINGYSGILMEDHVQSLNDECKKLLHNISGNIRKMTQLIEDLLNFSKLGRMEIHKTDMDTELMVRNVLEELIEPKDKDRVEIKIGKLEKINADYVLMKQVFHNLLSNAIKYSSKKDKAIIEIFSDKQPYGITYTIKDNGVGFDMRYADKLFDVFKRLHRSEEFEGTGVGLSIVQRIIAKHGGKVWADAKPNKGATFNFILPLS